MTAEPYYADDQVTLYQGECLDVLRELPTDSIDSVVTDPPYGIGFMGHEWDQPGDHAALSAGHGGSNISYGGAPHPAMEAGRYDLSQSANARFGRWCEAWAIECLRVLKPGGHILAFGGSRTWHRLQSGVEDAGFEIRDSIAWLYGSGFPKSLDVSKAIDKAAGAVRADGELTRDRVAHLRNERYASGPAGFATDRGTTLAAAAGPPVTEAAAAWAGWGTALKPGFEPIVVGRKPIYGTVASNVLAYGTGALNIDAARVAFLDGADEAESKNKNRHADFGTLAGGNEVYGDFTMVPRTNYEATGRWPTNVALDDLSATTLGRDARFFPTFHYEAKASASERPRLADGTSHPTVKPLDLMRWLARLVTPPGGTVLDPFEGSGTTAEACVIEGFRHIGIEREKKYLRLVVEGRLAKPIATVLFGDVAG